jgi:hypothetical protein
MKKVVCLPEERALTLFFNFFNFFFKLFFFCREMKKERKNLLLNTKFEFRYTVNSNSPGDLARHQPLCHIFHFVARNNK